MAFIRKRTTKNGVVSTALVESCRKDGKPRSRVLVNLHGAESLTVALGRLAAKRDKLKKDRAGLEPDRAAAEEFYEIFTSATMAGRVWTIEERKEIDGLLRRRRRLLKRVAKIDTELAIIQREGVAIKKHCAASPDEIRAEADKHAKELQDAENHELGLALIRGKSIESLMKAY